MAGKFTETEKDMKIGNNKINSNMVKVSSSKSILSYQNGSTLNIENCVYTEEPMQNGYNNNNNNNKDEENGNVGSDSCDDQNLKSECLDVLRKKLISDLSLNVFSTDLENKLTKMEPIEISKERHSVIQKLVVEIRRLSDAEKLLLYLKLPSSTSSPFDPLRQPLNPLGNRQEIQQTIVWIKTHLEEDREISIPKQDVYDQYLKYCENVSMKPLSTADFGKVMKQVYPGVRPRRLGTRGNSRYCYSGMRNTCKLPTPVLPRLCLQNNSDNDRSSDGSTSLPSSSAEKSKKMEKPKRKWKSSTSRSGKLFPAPNRNPGGDKDPANQLKTAKRTKIEGTIKGKEVRFSEEINPKLGEGQLVKSEIDVKCEESSDNSFNAFETIGYELANDIGLYFENIEKVEDGSSGSGDENKINGEDKKIIENLMAAKPNGLDCNKNPVVESDPKGKTKSRRANSFSKIQKNFKKSYVPIQPKPVELPKLNVRFDFDPTGQFVENKKSELCEESDSQEPEEEIVRYFQHLEENNQIVGADVFVGQAVKSINENNSVQISVTSQDLRSQSCFEVYPKQSQAPRSQSSVEFSFAKSENSDFADNKKISHLRILLEKSMTCGNENYSPVKETPEVNNFIPMNQIPSNIQPSSVANNFVETVPMDRPMLKLDQKLLNRAPLHIAQSPNTRTKYFSFTPISPGPQSPLKTPSTPSASPFVSPRNTPVPRSRQNSSQNDHFIPPSERKPIRSDFGNENVFNFNPAKMPNLPKETPMEYEEHNQTYRPRSFSSTNFYRSKARKNLSKVLTYERAIAPAPCNNQFQIPNPNFISTDSLSNEVQRLFENSKTDGQTSAFRSQSVPLNRMMGEHCWMTNQISPVYGQFFNFSNQPGNPTPTPVPSEFSDFVSSSNQDCSKGNSFPELVFSGDNQIPQLNAETLFPSVFETSNTESYPVVSDSGFDNSLTEVSVMSDNIKIFLPNFKNSDDKGMEEGGGVPEDPTQMNGGELFKNSLFEGNNENIKDPVITSFKPTLMGEFTSSPNSPDLNFFGAKMNEDNQLIELLQLDN